jgi:dTDP-L-rhamnose 4-epimerase
VRVVAGDDDGRRGRAAGSAQRLRGEQGGAGAPGGQLGAADRRRRDRAAIFRSCLENGVPPRVFEDGGQRRDFIHVRDVARANLLALSAVAGLAGGDGLAGGGDLAGGSLRCYNVASGEPHTVGEMASALAGAFGGSGSIEPVVTGEYRLGDVRHIVASPDGAARDLGFRAQTRFAKGMAEFASAPLREPALAQV